MIHYFCMNCGETTVYTEIPYPNAKSWEVEKQYENVRCSKCHSDEVYRYRTLWDWLLFKWNSWKEGWELYESQNTYSKRKLKKMREVYTTNSHLPKYMLRQSIGAKK